MARGAANPRDNGRMTSDPTASLPLGRAVDYPREYDPGLLFPIARALGRSEIGIDDIFFLACVR